MGAVIRPFHQVHADVFAGQVVDGREPRLEKQQRLGAVCHGHVVEDDLHALATRFDVDPVVGRRNALLLGFGHGSSDAGSDQR